MMKYAVCMFVCFLTLSEADQVIEHVLLADVRLNGKSFSYTNKNQCGGANERWLSELVGVTKISREPATALEKQLKQYNDNGAIKKAEMELDNPRSEAAKNYSTLVLVSAAPELIASSKTASFVFRKVDTCPERKYVLRYYWEIYRKRICRVVRPYQQYLTYVRCPQNNPCCRNVINSFCTPEGWVRRRFLVLCYDILTNSNIRWKIVTRCFPQCCDCHYFA